MEPPRRVRAESFPLPPPPCLLPSPAPPPPASSAGLRAFVSGRLRRGACPPPHAGLPRPRSSSLPSLLIYSFPWAASLKVQSLSVCASPCLPTFPPPPFSPLPTPASLPLGSGTDPRVRAPTPASLPVSVPFRPWRVPPGPQHGGIVNGPWGLGVPGAPFSRVNL